MQFDTQKPDKARDTLTTPEEHLEYFEYALYFNGLIDSQCYRHALICLPVTKF